MLHLTVYLVIKSSSLWVKSGLTEALLFKKIEANGHTDPDPGPWEGQQLGSRGGRMAHSPVGHWVALSTWNSLVLVCMCVHRSVCAQRVGKGEARPVPSQGGARVFPVWVREWGD